MSLPIDYLKHEAGGRPKFEPLAEAIRSGAATHYTQGRCTAELKLYTNLPRPYRLTITGVDLETARGIAGHVLVLMKDIAPSLEDVEKAGNSSRPKKEQEHVFRGYDLQKKNPVHWGKRREQERGEVTPAQNDRSGLLATAWRAVRGLGGKSRGR